MANKFANARIALDQTNPLSGILGLTGHESNHKAAITLNSRQYS